MNKEGKDGKDFKDFKDGEPVNLFAKAIIDRSEKFSGDRLQFYAHVNGCGKALMFDLPAVWVNFVGEDVKGGEDVKESNDVKDFKDFKEFEEFKDCKGFCDGHFFREVQRYQFADLPKYKSLTDDNKRLVIGFITGSKVSQSIAMLDFWAIRKV